MEIWIRDHTKQIIYNAEIKSSKNILIRYYFTINSIKRYQIMQYGEKRYNIPCQKSLTFSTVQHLNLIVIRNSKCISSSTFSDLVFEDIFFNFCYCRTSALTESVQALMKAWISIQNHQYFHVITVASFTGPILNHFWVQLSHAICCPEFWKKYFW